MKMLRAITTILLAAAFVSSALGQAVDWRPNYTNARAEAKKLNRLTMVFLYADWCTYSQRMLETTFKDTATAKRLQNVVPVMLNIEHTEGEKVKKQYKQKGTPTFLFIDPDGNMFGAMSGFMTPTLFRDEVAKFSDAFKNRAALLARYRRNPGDAEVNAQLAWMYGIQRKLEPALKHLSAAERGGYRGVHYARALNMVGDTYQLSERFPQAIDLFKRAKVHAKSKDDESYALVSIFSCYSQMKDRTNMAKYGKELINMKGANPEYVEFAKQVMKRADIKF
jgi:thioredoxin-related protein